MKNRTDRRGSVLALVVLFAFLISSALTALAYLTRGDAGGTAELVREVHANALAESIVAQLDARAARRPWSARFWLLEAQAAGAAAPYGVDFHQGSGHVDLTGDVLPADRYDYRGRIEDADVEQGIYRVIVEVTVDGQAFARAWERRAGDSLLRGITRVPELTALDLGNRAPGAAGTAAWVDAARTAALHREPDGDLPARVIAEVRPHDELVFIPPQYGLTIPSVPTLPPPPPPTAPPADATPIYGTLLIQYRGVLNGRPGTFLLAANGFTPVGWAPGDFDLQGPPSQLVEADGAQARAAHMATWPGAVLLRVGVFLPKI